MQQLDPSQTVSSAEIISWINTIPKDAAAVLQINKAEQNVINGHHVIRIPAGEDGAIFFTKVNGVLNEYAYKWIDQKPGAPKFTGKILSYSFQDNKFRGMVYKNGAMFKGGEYNGDNTQTSTRQLLMAAHVNKLMDTDEPGDGISLAEIWCIITGGRWTDMGEGVIAGQGLGCNYSQGWLHWLFSLFAADDSDPENSSGFPPAYLGFPPGVWYGQGAFTEPPVGASDGSYNPTDGGGNTGTTHPDAPYGGGPIWVSKWVDDGCPMGGGSGSDLGGGGGLGVPSDGGDCPGGSSGHWESVEVNIDDPRYDSQVTSLLDTTGLYKYPSLKQIVIDLPAFLQQYPNVLQALSYYTGFSTTKIMRLMQPNAGPKISVVQNLTTSSGQPLYGHYDDGPKVLQLDQSLVLSLNSASSLKAKQATALLLAITTLHEFVHYGRDANHLTDQFVDPATGAGYEAGWTFEANIAPNNTINGIYTYNAITWLHFYPFNF